jgi:hypothetical protein
MTISVADSARRLRSDSIFSFKTRDGHSMHVRNLLVLLSFGGLCACAAAPSNTVHPRNISGVHQLEILVFEGDELLQATIKQPDFAQAASLTEVFGASSVYKAQVSKADEEIRPLNIELNQERTKTKLGASIRDSLVASGIGVSRFEIQPFGNLAHTEHALEERAVNDKRGEMLLILVPTLRLSEDYRSLVVSVVARVYARDSSVPAAEDIFELRSTPVDGPDPIETWSASGGEIFYKTLDELQAKLGKQAMTMFGVS